MDYKDRLQEAGFEVTVDSYVSDLPDDMINKFGLRRENISAASRINSEHVLANSRSQ